MKYRLALVCGVLVAAAGCQKTESNTEIILEISTNIPVPAGMNTLSLKIGPQARPEAFAQTYPLGTGTGQIMLPRRMTLVPSDMNAVLSVRVEGLLSNKTVVSRLVNTKFVKDQSKLLRIELLQKCVGQVCPNDQTCTPNASCANPYVEPAGLPAFDPGKDPTIPGLDPDAGVSVDAPVDQFAGDGKYDGKDGLSSDSQPDSERGRGDGVDGVREDSLGIDGPSINPDSPGGTVTPPGPDGSVGVDTAPVVDAPITVSDVLPSSKTKGVACKLSGECASGLCVDEVCCEDKCDGMCMACNLPGNLGTCAPVPLNDPSNGDCPDDGVATCGRNGRCNGAGGCMMYAKGVACSAETCPAGTSNHTRQGLCDGEGHCGKGQLQDCAPFLCNATTKTCNPTCTYDADCVSPNQCTSGSCGKKGNGLPCSTGTDCQSTICAQGVCCGDSCTDLCKSCAVEGSLGICTFVPAGKPDLQSRCLDQGTATCGNNGLCNGAGACQKYGDGLVCGAKCDPGAATFTTSTCSAGACGPGASQSCAPYTCDNSGCKKSCSLPTDCATGFTCGAGGLCVHPTEDCMNGVDDDGDGQVDCADPDCTAGFMCVPAVPDGFTGPVEVAERATQADLPACGGAYLVEKLTGWGSLQCPPGTCSGCSCGSLTGADCNNPGLEFGNTKDLDLTFCTRELEPIPSLIKCEGPLSSLLNRLHFTVGAVTSKGSCPHIGGTLISPAPAISWNAVRTCGLQEGKGGGGGCAANSICWPKPQNTYQPQACVVGSGNLTCPASGYAARRDYFDSSDVYDGRTCSGCSCSPSDVSCEAKLFSSAGSVCSTKEPLATVSTSGTRSVCMPAASGNYFHIPTPVLSGSCTVTGSPAPSGGCTPKGNQTTVCCTP